MNRGSGSSPQVYQSTSVAVAFDLHFCSNFTVTSKQKKEGMPMIKTHYIQNDIFMKIKISWRLIKKSLTIVTAVSLIGVYGDSFSSSA